MMLKKLSIKYVISKDRDFKYMYNIHIYIYIYIHYIYIIYNLRIYIYIIYILYIMYVYIYTNIPFVTILNNKILKNVKAKSIFGGKIIVNDADEDL